MALFRTSDKHLRFLLFITLITLLATACQQGESASTTARQTAVPPGTPALTNPNPTPTFTPSLTPLPSSTPTATPTPTITPTPTPTARPITIVDDNLRESRVGPPVPNGNAPCGVVDLLDFPLDPPDGATASGGGDFGRFRSRYDKFHAGEDWWSARGRNSFGEPVYSIGHGLVTYAEPEGWNRDKGVIIIRHTFADGSDVLSFYGHLDPPSFQVEAGDCVERGEQIAQIGRPLSSPHLHFEIRTQAPYETLTGYWPEDPTLAGWLPPSAFIWTQRVSTSPGVRWAMPDSVPYAFEDNQYVGLLNGDSLITLQSFQLTGTSIEDGRQLWQLDREDDVNQITRVYSALIDQHFPILYIANRSGQIEALSLLSGQGDRAIPSLQPLWEIELDVFGRTDLLPLPGGGLLVAVDDRLFAINSDGAFLWETEEVGEPTAWTLLDDSLLLPVTGEDDFFGTADAGGLHTWDFQGNWPGSSIPIVAGDRVWLYSRDGLYQLNLETETADLSYPLSRGIVSLGDIIGLPDGGVLLAHADSSDRRLLAFNADGSLRWERSYEAFISGSIQLIEENGRIYLLNDEDGDLTLYAVDLDNAALSPIFVGGTRASDGEDSWMVSAEDYLIISIGGGNMVALDLG